MKRSKFIAGLVALSMVLMGTGYAYWTDRLEIQTTATTGELEVKFADIVPYGQYSGEHGWTIYDGTGTHIVTTDSDEDSYLFEKTPNRTSAGTTNANNGYNDLGNANLDKYEEKVKEYNSIQTEVGRGTDQAGIITMGEAGKAAGDYASDHIILSDVMSMHVDNMYPGYAEFFEGDILNVGTVAAKLSTIKYEIEFAESVTAEQQVVLKDMIGVSLDVISDLGTTPGNRTLKDLFTDAEKFTIGEREFVRYSAIEAKGDALKLPLNKFIIKVNDDHATRLDVFAGIAMDPDKEGNYTTGHTGDLKDKDDTLSQLAENIKITAVFNWDQFNAPDNTHNPNDENKPAQ